jgi:hypothetical protein
MTSCESVMQHKISPSPKPKETTPSKGRNKHITITKNKMKNWISLKMCWRDKSNEDALEKLM